MFGVLKTFLSTLSPQPENKNELITEEVETENDINNESAPIEQEQIDEGEIQNQNIEVPDNLPESSDTQAQQEDVYRSWTLPKLRKEIKNRGLKSKPKDTKDVLIQILLDNPQEDYQNNLFIQTEFASETATQASPKQEINTPSVLQTPISSRYSLRSSNNSVEKVQTKSGIRKSIRNSSDFIYEQPSSQKPTRKSTRKSIKKSPSSTIKSNKSPTKSTELYGINEEVDADDNAKQNQFKLVYSPNRPSSEIAIQTNSNERVEEAIQVTQEVQPTMEEETQTNPIELSQNEIITQPLVFVSSATQVQETIESGDSETFLVEESKTSVEDYQDDNIEENTEDEENHDEYQLYDQELLEEESEESNEASYHDEDETQDNQEEESNEIEDQENEENDDEYEDANGMDVVDLVSDSGSAFPPAIEVANNNNVSNPPKTDNIPSQPGLLTALEAFSKLSNKLITTAQETSSEVKPEILSEKEYELLKGFLDKFKPPSFSEPKAAEPQVQEKETSQATTSSLEVDEDVFFIDDYLRTKRVKFNSSEKSLPRPSFDGGNWTSRDSFLPATSDSPVVRFNVPFVSFDSNIKSHDKDLYNKVRLPTPYHPPLPASESKKRNYFDYSQVDDESQDIPSNKRLSGSFEKVATPFLIPQTQAIVPSIPTAQTPLNLANPITKRTPFTPQFRGGVVQFNNLSSNGLTENHKSAEAGLSFLEKRKLQRQAQAQTKPGSTVAKQILEALSSISSPMESINKQTVPRVFNFEKPEFNKATLPLNFGQTKTETQQSKPLNVQNLPSSNPPLHSREPENKVSFSFPTTTNEKVKNPNLSENIFQNSNKPTTETNILSTKPPVSLPIESDDSEQLAEIIELNKKKNSGNMGDAEFIFEEPLLLSGVEDLVDSKDNSIKYMFSPPNKKKQKKVVFLTSPDVNEEKEKFKFPPTPAPTRREEPKEELLTPAPSIWSMSNTSDGVKCKACLVRNKAGATKCVSCETPLENISTPMVPPPSSFATPAPANLSNKISETPSNSIWSMANANKGIKCKVCLVQNSPGAVKCASCESPLGDVTVAPAALPVTPAPTPSNITFGTTPAAPSSSFSINSIPLNSDNKATTATSGFGFNVPKTENQEKKTENPPTFTFGSTTKPTSLENDIKTSEVNKPSFSFGSANNVPSNEISKPLDVNKAVGFSFPIASAPAPVPTPSTISFEINSKKSTPQELSTPSGPGFTFGATSNTFTEPKKEETKTISFGSIPPAKDSISFNSGVPAFNKKVEREEGEDVEEPSRRTKRRAEENDSNKITETPSSNNVVPNTFPGFSNNKPAISFSFGSSNEKKNEEEKATESKPAFTFGKTETTHFSSSGTPSVDAVKTTPLFGSSSSFSAQPDNLNKDALKPETKPSTNFSFGANPNTTTPVISFGGSSSTAKDTTNPFSSNTATAAGLNPSVPSFVPSSNNTAALNPPATQSFSFGNSNSTPTVSNSSFSFGNTSNSSSAPQTTPAPTGFTFGSTTQPVIPPATSFVSNSTPTTTNPFTASSTTAPTNPFSSSTLPQTSSQPTAPNAFGSSNVSFSSTPGFNSSNTTAPLGAFGSSTTTPSTFVAPSTNATGFGSSSNVPTFGAPANAPTFGAPSSVAPAFGVPTTSTPVFGAPSSSNNPIFGAPSTAAPAFGAPVSNIPAVNPGFGAPSAATPAFGGFGSNSSGPFGTNQTNGFQSQVTGPFGASSANMFGSQSIPTSVGSFPTPTSFSTDTSGFNPAAPSNAAAAGGFSMGSSTAEPRRKLKVKRN